MNTYADDYLEYYADRYVALYLKGHGITLQQYLAAPDRYEHLAFAPLPLLPAQHNVVLRLWHGWDTGLTEQTEAASEGNDIETQTIAWDWSDLLDQWRDEVAQSERELCQMSQRNGAAFEPMRHHRHNRGNARCTSNFSRKQARKGA
ncbi:hypothetical protein Q8G38_17060 [Halomonas venusta]|uniref:hypothetical protein n=1 Tax=Vreelandella venusta TaxID=44935 RepID=UPI00295ED830|nr:hypothetical protein [Halomonas venusta]MDW0361027.1 hypothetical protein [Halomonas venusta]